MKKIHILFLFFFSLVYACKESVDTALPENILAIDKLAPLLADMEIIEAAVVKKLVKSENYDTLFSKIYGEILLKHQVDKEQFKESYIYYLEHPQQLELLYDQVINELSKKQAAVKMDKPAW
jgi:hypothetical protein